MKPPWACPYKVLERQGKVNYLIDNTKGAKLYHTNLLKRYHHRIQINFAEVLNEVSNLEEESFAGMKISSVEVTADDTSSQLPIIPDGETDSFDSKVVIKPTLNWNQLADIEELMHEFKDIFSDVPGCTPTIQHDISPDHHRPNPGLEVSSPDPSRTVFQGRGRHHRIVVVFPLLSRHDGEEI